MKDGGCPNPGTETAIRKPLSPLLQVEMLLTEVPKPLEVQRNHLLSSEDQPAEEGKEQERERERKRKRKKEKEKEEPPLLSNASPPL